MVTGLNILLFLLPGMLFPGPVCRQPPFVPLPGLYSFVPSSKKASLTGTLSFVPVAALAFFMFLSWGCVLVVAGSPMQGGLALGGLRKAVMNA